MTYTLLNKTGVIAVSYDGDISEKFELGETIEDVNNGMYILLNDAQKTFYYQNIRSTPEEIINMQRSDIATDYDRQKVIDKIEEYNISNNIDIFTLNGNPTWINLQSRMVMAHDLNMAKLLGKETITFWLDGVEYILNTDQGIQLLSQLESYALQCQNRTEEHKKNVSNITSYQELQDYDYTTGYPEKLEFNL